MREIHKGHRALNLKPLEHTLSIVYIDTLEDIYEAINARCFDITDRQIGTNPERVYSIYYYDEGLLKDDAYLSAYGNKDCLIVGDIIITKHDAQGEMVDLKDSDIDYIGKQVWRVVDNMHRELDVLFPISYPNYNIYGRSVRR